MLAPTEQPKPPDAASTRSLVRFPTTKPLVLQPFFLALTAQDRRRVDGRPVVLQPYLELHAEPLAVTTRLGRTSRHVQRQRNLNGAILFSRSDSSPTIWVIELVAVVRTSLLSLASFFWQLSTILGGTSLGS